MDTGDDALKAFLLSSEAALTGAESTKNMHAQVIPFPSYHSRAYMVCKPAVVNVINYKASTI